MGHNRIYDEFVGDGGKVNRLRLAQKGQTTCRGLAKAGEIQSD